MSIPFEGFCGPSYQLEDKYAAVERLANWRLVANESPTEKKWRLALGRTPGNKQFCELPVPAPYNVANRGLIENRGKVFGVNGAIVFEMDSAGAFVNNIGTVVDDGKPVGMVANGNGQIFICSANRGYVIPNQAILGGALITIPYPHIPTAFLGATYTTFQDGYIINIVPNSNQFQISGDPATPVGDATIWNAQNVAVLAGQSDKLRACISRREYLRILGQRRSEIFQNVGTAGIGAFPFQNFNSTFIETGISAPFSLADVGDGYMWMGEDARGIRACWLDRSFNPQRVSNFAVEHFWQSYDHIDDAVAFTYIWKGHLIYRITFPRAYESAVRFPLGATSGALTSATWEYDATLSELMGRPIWSELQFLTGNGFFQGRPELFHCYAFGKHLIGSGGVDGNPGAIYQMSDTAYTDCGTDAAGAQSQQAIVRDRICPHLYADNVRIRYDRISFDVMRGVGLDGFAEDSMEPGADPQLLLRWSNDAGNTFGNEFNLPVGKIGRFGTLVRLNRLGQGRDRVYWVRYTEPTDMGFVGASLDIRPGT
jgi:hypothetical protein